MDDCAMATRVALSQANEAIIDGMQNLKPHRVICRSVIL